MSTKTRITENRAITARIAQMETDAGTAGDLMMAAICQLAQGAVDPRTYAVLSAEDQRRIDAMTNADAREICENVYYGDVDTSDIPEQGAEFFARAKRMPQGRGE